MILNELEVEEGNDLRMKADDEICDECQRINVERTDAKNKDLSERKAELSKSGMRALVDQNDLPAYFLAKNVIPPAINHAEPKVYDAHFLVSLQWLEKWRKYHSNTGAKPGALTNSELKCSCNLALIPDKLRELVLGEQLEIPDSVVENSAIPKAAVVTEEQWKSLKELYGPSDEDMKEAGAVDEVFEVKLVGQNGSLLWEPACCVKCVDDAKNAFAEQIKSWEGSNSQFFVTILAGGDSVPGDSTVVCSGRPSRRRAGRVEHSNVSCERSYSVYQLKQEIEKLANIDVSLQVGCSIHRRRVLGCVL